MRTEKKTSVDSYKDLAATNLKALMERDAIGATALGKAVGVDRQMVYQWLKDGAISEKMAQKLAQHFKVTPAALRYGSYAVDRRLLTALITGIEDWLADNQRNISPEKKAEIILYLYDRYVLANAGQDEQRRDINVLASLATDTT